MVKIKVISTLLMLFCLSGIKVYSQINISLTESGDGCFKYYLDVSTQLLNSNNFQLGSCEVSLSFEQFPENILAGFGGTGENGQQINGYDIFYLNGKVIKQEVCGELMFNNQNEANIRITIYNYTNSLLTGPVFNAEILESTVEYSPDMYIPTHKSCINSYNLDPQITSTGKVCIGKYHNFVVETNYPNMPLGYLWFLNGQEIQGNNIGVFSRQFQTPGEVHTLQVRVSHKDMMYGFEETSFQFTTEACPCEECESSFAPEPGKKYILSAWVKESGALTQETYTAPQIQLEFNGDVHYTFLPSGRIVEGWQRIHGEFIVPADAVEFSVELGNTQTGGTGSDKQVYFDDIRIHPFNAMMKSFVYDPKTLEFLSEHDENGFATFYEYDMDGSLIRVKQETEKGIMTIKETRSNLSKQE